MHSHKPPVTDGKTITYTDLLKALHNMAVDRDIDREPRKLLVKALGLERHTCPYCGRELEDAETRTGFCTSDDCPRLEEEGRRNSYQLFNSYRKGLPLFALYDRNGKQHGLLYAGSASAAARRAKNIVGAGATVEYACDY